MRSVRLREDLRVWMQPLLLSLGVAGALIAGPGRVRFLLAFVPILVALALLLAFPPAPIPLRAWSWLGVGFLALRLIDVLGDPAQPPAARVGLEVLIFDPRDMTPAAPVLDTRLLVKFAGFGALLLLAAAVITWACPQLPRPWSFGLRWLCGLVFFYSLVDSLEAAARALFALLGQRALPLQRTPILSRSLGEFWGRRWNREVGRWLHRWCFRPLARRRHPALGLTAAFVVSGLLHAVPILAALGVWPAVAMGGFFVVQGVLVLAERALGVERWPPLYGRLWTIGAFIVTGPLFVEPGLQVMGAAPLG